MLIYYFKQALTMIKQNKLFSFIYIMGTALSIALIMTIFIIFYVRFASVYPEYNRSETIVLKRMQMRCEDGQSSGSVSYRFLTEIAPRLSTLKHIAAIYPGDTGSVEHKEGKETIDIWPVYVNHDFWNVFTFNFISGVPFNEADVRSIKRDVVISKSISQKLFATAESVGRKLEMNGEEYRVCGVVADVTSATPATAADIWLPITLQSGIVDNYNPDMMTGPLNYYMIPIAGQKKVLKQDIARLFDEINLLSEEWKHDLMGQPDDYWFSTFRVWSNSSPDLWNIAREIGLLLLSLILIPAINLSGMVSSRMDKRMSELGVRKAFGATRGTLIKHVLWENMILTSVGGILGLLFSYIIVLSSSSWILSVFDNRIDDSKYTSITPEMLFNPMVFFIAFGVCIVLNLTSALIPSINAMRHAIIYSLNTQK